MKTITQEEFVKILENHQQYLNQNCEDWENMHADLSNADLRYADLRYADLNDANLKGADLKGADLRYADLRHANLNGADLRYADLSNADLRYADLNDANLRGAIGNLIEYRKGKILSDAIIGYKKCQNNIIVTLEIPAGAVVFSINGNKCRTNKCKVVAIDGANKAISIYNSSFTYEVGKEIIIDDFNLEYNVECSNGIHFFMTKDEAINFD